MASADSLPRTWRYRVFTSFHGPDVRKTFLSHLRKQFTCNGISMFDDQGIERSHTIAPALTQAIRESRISIVVLSKNYASSSWCLDELLGILKCKEEMGQIVMTVFYGVDPSDVRKQTGDFGKVFKNTCARKTKEEMRRWSQALNDVGNIAGEHLLNWNNEANMIEKIARGVLDKLNATPSRDFDGMVGLEAHLIEIESLLNLDYDGVKMVAITGPAGIGKTTIARALQSLLSHKFQLTCFVDNLRENYHSGLDDYGMQLRLQERFISKVLNQNGTRICHLGAVKKILCDQRVLIILDDVNNIKQLEALANETTWFGPGSRIIVTTENKELLQQHGINNTYHVGFPSHEEAVKILCRYAFRINSMYHGFEGLATRVTALCGNLPLGLRVVGSSLRGKNENEWKEVIQRLETILDHQDIEEVLRVGYESLHENEQSLFLHIAVFFNCDDGDLVKAMLADNNLDIKHGLKILVNRSLVHISTNGEIVMHKLLQLVGRQAINRQEPWERRILTDAQEICDVLEADKGTRTMSGISFDISGIDEVSIGKKAFKRMHNLRFLKVYKRRYDGNDRMLVPEEMEFPRRLRLLQWEAYPSKCLPPTFQTEYLVKLDMKSSQLEYLWQGTKPLTNLRKMNLYGSSNLKELPDLSNATNLEELNLGFCESLVEIPSSFSHLHKLQKLLMYNCINLQLIPAHLNLASLDSVNIDRCSRLRNFPVISKHVTELSISKTAVEDLPSPMRLCSRLFSLNLSGNGKLKGLTHLPTSLVILGLMDSDIESIPDCIKALHQLSNLGISGCRRLASLPELPGSLSSLYANDCESLETVFFPVNTPSAVFCFTNCFKLDQQTQRAIIQRPFRRGSTRLPGREVPAEFDHRARGNSLTIHLDGNKPLFVTFKFCLVISPNNQINECCSQPVLCRRIVNGDLDPDDEEFCGNHISKCRTEHLFIFKSDLRYFHSGKVSSEVVFEFRSKYHDLDIVECGAQILEDDTDLDIVECGAQILSPEVFQNSNQSEPLEDGTEYGDRTYEEICDSKEEEDLRGETHTDCWNSLFFCFNLSDFVRNIRSLVSGKKTIEAGNTRAQSPSPSSPLAISSQS